MKKILILIISLSFTFSAYVKILNQGANLRSAPMGNVIGQAYPCPCKYRILEAYSDWTLVRVEVGTNNIKGWVTTRKLDDYDKIISQGCNIRAMPTKDSRKLGVLSAGTKVLPIKEIYTWYRIKVGDTVGWIWSKVVRVVKDT